MRERRTRRVLSGAAALCAAITLAGCGGEGSAAGDQEQVETAMQSYVSSLPPAESETDLHGPVERVGCARTMMQFRGDDVWICGVTHRTGTVAEWCGVLRGEELLTTRHHLDMPCSAGHR